MRKRAPWVRCCCRFQRVSSTGDLEPRVQYAWNKRWPCSCPALRDQCGALNFPLCGIGFRISSLPKNLEIKPTSHEKQEKPHEKNTSLPHGWSGLHRGLADHG